MSDFQLAGPEFVAKCLSDSDAAGHWKVLEAHFTSIDHPLDPDLPNTFHIPGAIQVHPSYLEAGTNRKKYYPFYDCPADGNLLTHDQLVAALKRIGLTPDTPVIVYGSEPDGTMAAARLIWGLMYCGIKTIRLLDGGIDAWRANGGTTEHHIKEAWRIGSTDKHIVTEPDSRWQERRDFLASTGEVLCASNYPKKAKCKLVDVRKPGEWDGTLTDYYPFFTDAGHIPNACLQGDWDNLLDMASHKLAPKLNAVAQRWRHQGIIDSDVGEGSTSLIFYCGTGWRSSISFLVARLLGLNAKNYDGGFYRWTSIKENKIAYGRPSSGKFGIAPSQSTC